MKLLKKTESLYFILFVSLVFVFWFLLYCPCSHVQHTEKPWLPRDPTNLKQVLRKSTMGDRTVILTIVDETWARPNSILDLFLESFRVGIGTKRLLNHLVIVAADELSYRYCKSVHQHCFDLTTFGISSLKNSVNKPDYRFRLGWKKIELLLQVIELGFHFVYTDADVMWLRNPVLQFNIKDEIKTSCKFYTGDPKDETNVKDEGILYVRSTDMSLEFFRYWYMARTLYPNSDEQYVFEIIKYDEFFKSIGLHITYLDTAIFSSFCEQSQYMNMVVTMRANCCDGDENKLHDIKLVLEDWRNFTGSFYGTKGLGVASSLMWRAPSKCWQR